MFSWFKDWDGATMQNATGIAALYGYRAVSGFAFGKSDGSDVQSAIDSDSVYVRALKFMYEANKRGLVDPESTTQNFDTLASNTQMDRYFTHSGHGLVQDTTTQQITLQPEKVSSQLL